MYNKYVKKIIPSSISQKEGKKQNKNIERIYFKRKKKIQHLFYTNSNSYLP